LKPAQGVVRGRLASLLKPLSTRKGTTVNKTAITLTLIAALCAATASAAERRTVIDAPRGQTVITQQRGADGLTDRVVTRSDGSTVMVDRTRGADGVVNATRTGPTGRTWRVDRRRGSDGAIDATRTRPDGSTVTIDRQRP
jgi:hypothetical protein